MALKIQNTTVITDARELANVTNLRTVNGESVLGTGNITVGGSGGTSPTANLYTGGSLIHTLNNPNAFGSAPQDWFGNSVSISGNYAIVAAYGEYFSTFTYASGKCYIFDVSTGALLHTLNNPNTYGNPTVDWFGVSVSISGNRAIVGAYGEDEASNSASGKAYIFDVSTGALLHTLNNPNAYGTSASDWFGNSVSISGNYAIVGAYLEDESGGSNSGKAYIFNVATGALLHTLNNPNAYDTAADDWFGYSVAISGNYAIVGSFDDDSGGSGSGKAYIFDVTTGALLHTLNNPNAYGTSASDLFGFSVAISGNYAIVGAYGEGDSGGSFSGKAYIFNVATGALLHTLNNPNAYGTSASDEFGNSVSISGNYAIVAAIGEDESGNTDSGKAYIFNVTTGALLHTLNNPNAYDTAADDDFGFSVAISGNYAIVGAYLEDEVGITSSGKAYIFAADSIFNIESIDSLRFANDKTLSSKNKILEQAHVGGQLLHKLQSPYTDRFGDNFYIVDTSHHFVVAASPFEGLSESIAAGRAYVFDAITGRLLHTLINPNSGSFNDDDFGAAISVSGRYAVIGAPDEDQGTKSDTGTAYVFDLLTGTYLRRLAKPNDVNSSYFASAVGLSGKYAIIGAYADDALAGNSGIAYIYDITTGTLIHTLNNPNAYDTSDTDEFGWAVDISGSYAVASARLEDENGFSGSGKVYVFDVPTGALLRTINNPNPGVQNFFGDSVSISQNYIIVGAPNEDISGDADSGRAYIFNASTGALIHTLTNPNVYGTGASDQFGYSVSISGNRAIVGAPGEDGRGTGRAYIFDVVSGSLLYILDNTTTSAFGRRVAIDKYAVVGDPFEVTEEGRVYVYSIADQTFLEKLSSIY